jgi:chitin synthase
VFVKKKVSEVNDENG